MLWSWWQAEGDARGPGQDLGGNNDIADDFSHTTCLVINFSFAAIRVSEIDVKLFAFGWLVLKVVVVTGRGVGRGSLNKGVYTSVSEKGQVRS